MIENGKRVAKETIPITIDILGHLKRINFDVTRISTYDAVLELLWLEKHNLTINYRNRTMTFNNCSCTPKADTNIREMLIRVMNAYY
jgi:hypothetical protein